MCPFFLFFIDGFITWSVARNAKFGLFGNATEMLQEHRHYTEPSAVPRVGWGGCSESAVQLRDLCDIDDGDSYSDWWPTHSPFLWWGGRPLRLINSFTQMQSGGRWLFTSSQTPQSKIKRFIGAACTPGSQRYLMFVCYNLHEVKRSRLSVSRFIDECSGCKTAV